MSEVTDLDWSHRKLDDVDCTDYTQLRNMNLSYNNLTATDGLLQCYLLTNLNLAHNFIGRLEGWYCFEQLTILDLSYNQLTSVYGLRNCSKVKVLHLHHNLLKSLEGLEGMHDLEHLNLAHNWLSEVSTSVRLLALNTKLQTLWFLGNPLDKYKQACWSLLDSLTVLDDEFTPPSCLRSRQPARNSYAINMSRGKRGMDLYKKYEHSLSAPEQQFVNRLKQPKIVATTRSESSKGSKSSRRDLGKLGVSLLDIQSPPVISPRVNFSDPATELDMEKFMQMPLKELVRKDVYQHNIFSVPNIAPMASLQGRLGTGGHSSRESPKSVRFSPRVEQFTVDSYDPFESVQSERRTQLSDVKGSSDDHRTEEEKSSENQRLDEVLKSASLSEEDISEYITLLQEKKKILENLKSKEGT